MNQTRDRIVGLVRTSVQGFFAFLLTEYADIIERLGLTDEAGALAQTVTAFVVAAVLGVYWLVLNLLQKSELVQENPIFSILVGGLAGGQAPPSYDA